MISVMYLITGSSKAAHQLLFNDVNRYAASSKIRCGVSIICLLYFLRKEGGYSFLNGFWEQ